MNETQHLTVIQSRLGRIERLLKQKQENITLMTIVDAVNFTRLSASTIRRAIYAGNLEVVSGGRTLGGGRKILINQSALITWLEN